MSHVDFLIRNVCIVDGSGNEPCSGDVAIDAGRISAIGANLGSSARQTLDGQGRVLAPGFIDVHTHDDLEVIRKPQMPAKLSQGVTTVVVGNCGISAAPVSLRGSLPDPMNLLGCPEEFRYASFATYVCAVSQAQPAVNVAALVGHTALRSNQIDRLDRAATGAEIQLMRQQLAEALSYGAIGLSSGLAYLSAYSASGEEILGLAEMLASNGAVYATHLRDEGAAILEAMQEAIGVARQSRVPLLLSHLKCAGVDNWGRSGEVLQLLHAAREEQQVACDCYPYAASSSTLDLRQVDPRVNITITWSEPHPEMAGQPLAKLAERWQVDLIEAARRVSPAGAIYHSMAEDDVRRILSDPASMIGSDGLPCDPRPHPRLWGTFPRVLGRYCREEKLFSLPAAVHKMTGLPAAHFGLEQRGLVREGYFADLVLFDPETIADTATYDEPRGLSRGIHAVWVNGVLSWVEGASTGRRDGRFLPRRGSHTIQS